MAGTLVCQVVGHVLAETDVEMCSGVLVEMLVGTGYVVVHGEPDWPGGAEESA